MIHPVPTGKSSAIWAINTTSLLKRASEIRGSWQTDIDAVGRKDTFNQLFYDRADRLRSRTFIVGPDGSDTNVTNVIVAARPEKLNIRLSIQQGLFLCAGAVEETFENILCRMLTGQTDSDWLVKIDIAAEARLQVLKRLRAMNITEQSLFLGLFLLRRHHRSNRNDNPPGDIAPAAQPKACPRYFLRRSLSWPATRVG
jgi:hypothetical protein